MATADGISCGFAAAASFDVAYALVIQLGVRYEATDCTLHRSLFVALPVELVVGSKECMVGVSRAALVGERADVALDMVLAVKE